MRVDTTVVETDIHLPDRQHLAGGRRSGADPGPCVRSQRSLALSEPSCGTGAVEVKLRLLAIGRVARAKGPINQDKLKQRYRQLLAATSRAVGQGKALLRGDCPRREAVDDHLAATGTWRGCARNSTR